MTAIVLVKHVATVDFGQVDVIQPVLATISRELTSTSRRRSCSRLERPTSLKLYYFDVAGRAESSRLALTAAGIPFEDVRFSKEEWPAKKPMMPFHQLPVLEVDNKVMIPQSDAIFTYCCRLGNFIPTHPLLEAHGNAICGVVDDLVSEGVGPWYYAPPEKKEETAARGIEEHFNKKLPLLDAFIARRQKNGFIAEGRLTKADLMVFAFVHNLHTTGFPYNLRAHVDEKYPHIKKVVDAVKGVEAIRLYYHF